MQDLGNNFSISNELLGGQNFNHVFKGQMAFNTSGCQKEKCVCFTWASHAFTNSRKTIWQQTEKSNSKTWIPRKLSSCLPIQILKISGNKVHFHYLIWSLNAQNHFVNLKSFWRMKKENVRFQSRLQVCFFLLPIQIIIIRYF